MFVYCHVVIFAETMERDLEQEQLLGDIVLGGGDPLSFLNDTDGQEGEDDGSGDPTMEEEGDHDSSGNRMPEEADHDGFVDILAEEGDHDDGSGDRMEQGAAAKFGEVYIIIKPVLT